MTLYVRGSVFATESERRSFLVPVLACLLVTLWMPVIANECEVTIESDWESLNENGRKYGGNVVVQICEVSLTGEFAGIVPNSTNAGEGFQLLELLVWGSAKYHQNTAGSPIVGSAAKILYLPKSDSVTLTDTARLSQGNVRFEGYEIIHAIDDEILAPQVSTEPPPLKISVKGDRYTFSGE